MNRLQRFFSDNWAIQSRDFSNQMALIIPAVLAGNLNQAADMLAETKCTAKAIGLPNIAESYEFSDMSLPDDSVAIISMTGCLYSWESEWVAAKIREAAGNHKICGIILAIDGPGGMVSHVEAVVKALKECPKPTATVVTGVMASAHFWIGSSADMIFATSRLCEIGSVGSVITVCDYSKFYEMSGIDYREIYPDSADLKNRAFRDLISSGDETLYKEKAARIHQIFSETVAENLGIKLDPELPLFRGEMFCADEALSAGYIHAMGDIADAARWILGKATGSKVKEYV
ncbi:MAG: S49 family peptidase [Bacteroides sp.]|nr:S49 family peptidase [Bacteroides sp.]